MTETRSNLRRTQMLASVLLALAALALWGASRLRWARILAGDGLAPVRNFDVRGADWSPWLAPLALVLLAAILAAMSLRGWGLRLVAILVAAGGVLAAFPAVSLLVEGTDEAYAARAIDLADRYAVYTVTPNIWVAIVVLAGTVCSVAAAVLLLRVASGAGLSTKYRTPAARRDEVEAKIFADHELRKAAAAGDTGPDEPSERLMWDALDTGIDPTDPTERRDDRRG